MESSIFTNLSIKELRGVLKKLIKAEFEKLVQHQGNNNERILTQDDVLEILRITKPTLYAWERQGLIKRYSIGGRVYYLWSELVGMLRDEK